jgi:hypothetical protein
MGKHSKSVNAQVKIPLRKTCSLSRFGYTLDTPSKDREKMLIRAVKAYGSRYVIHKLTVLRTYRKKQPTSAQYKALDTDIRFVQSFRNAMSNIQRQKNKNTAIAYQQLDPSNKVFC